MSFIIIFGTLSSPIVHFPAPAVARGQACGSDAAIFLITLDTRFIFHRRASYCVTLLANSIWKRQRRFTSGVQWGVNTCGLTRCTTVPVNGRSSIMNNQLGTNFLQNFSIKPFLLPVANALACSWWRCSGSLPLRPSIRKTQLTLAYIALHILHLLLTLTYRPITLSFQSPASCDYDP